jgi:structure-specific recognition protein 1
MKCCRHSGTSAVGCAYKSTAGFVYPLEKGFVYVNKPPMYIRYEEVAVVHFARSDVSTRSFDFEVELKSGTIHVFNSIEKYVRCFAVFLNHAVLQR